LSLTLFRRCRSDDDETDGGGNGGGGGGGNGGADTDDANTRKLELNAGVIANILAATQAMPSWKALEWYSRRKHTKICFFDRRRNVVEL